MYLCYNKRIDYRVNESQKGYNENNIESYQNVKENKFSILEKFPQKGNCSNEKCNSDVRYSHNNFVCVKC